MRLAILADIHEDAPKLAPALRRSRHSWVRPKTSFGTSTVSLADANGVDQNRSMILLASSLPSRCAAAFKLAMCCDGAAALAGADAVLVAVDFTVLGAGFFLAGVEAAGVGFGATAAGPDACLSLVLMVATNLPVTLTPFSSLICWAMAVGPFSGYLSR